MQENNWVITTKKGKGKLPLFCGNGERVISKSVFILPSTKEPPRLADIIFAIYFPLLFYIIIYLIFTGIIPNPVLKEIIINITVICWCILNHIVREHIYLYLSAPLEWNNNTVPPLFLYKTISVVASLLYISPHKLPFET